MHILIFRIKTNKQKAELDPYQRTNQWLLEERGVGGLGKWANESERYRFLFWE